MSGHPLPTFYTLCLGLGWAFSDDDHPLSILHPLCLGLAWTFSITKTAAPIRKRLTHKSYLFYLTPGSRRLNNPIVPHTNTPNPNKPVRVQFSPQLIYTPAKQLSAVIKAPYFTRHFSIFDGFLFPKSFTSPLLASHFLFHSDLRQKSFSHLRRRQLAGCFLSKPFYSISGDYIVNSISDWQRDKDEGVKPFPSSL